MSVRSPHDLLCETELSGVWKGGSLKKTLRVNGSKIQYESIFCGLTPVAELGHEFAALKHASTKWRWDPTELNANRIFNSCLEDRISWRVKGSYLMTHATHLTWHPSELMTWHPSQRSLNAKKENYIHSVQQHSCHHWPQWLSMTMATTLLWKRKVKLLKSFSSWRWLSHSWSRAPTMSHPHLS